MAGGRSGARHVDVCRHHGIAAVAETVRLRGGAGERDGTARLWRHVGLLAGLVLETIIAGLMAPVVMLTQTIDVAAILCGRDLGWNVQRRDGGAIPVRETVRLYRRHTILGALLGGAAWFVSPSHLAAWMLPVVLGLALAIPMVLWTGRASRRAMLLRTPEQMRAAARRVTCRRVAARMGRRWGRRISRHC